MCHGSCVIFGAKNLLAEEIKGKKVLEVGACDYANSLRLIVEAYHPAEYVGVDMKKGPGVDVVCNAENLVERFGNDSFDVVISTGTLEHVRDWKKVLSNIKNVCKPGGIILITAPSKGFPYHAYPYDFWRYELEDAKNIFSDFEILVIEDDFQAPGILLKVKKPGKFTEKDLSGYKMYSIIENERTNKVTSSIVKNRRLVRTIIKDLSKRAINKAKRTIK